MAALRVLGSSVAPWGQYAYQVSALGTLLVPRAARWGRRWLRSRVDERLVLARAVGATTQVS